MQKKSKSPDILRGLVNVCGARQWMSAQLEDEFVNSKEVAETEVTNLAADSEAQPQNKMIKCVLFNL